MVEVLKLGCVKAISFTLYLVRIWSVFFQGVEGNKQGPEAGKGDRSASKPCQTGANKKPERKVAGSAVKCEKGTKPAAWK